jgi:hypothetical protein
MRWALAGGKASYKAASVWVFRLSSTTLISGVSSKLASYRKRK